MGQLKKLFIFLILISVFCPLAYTQVNETSLLADIDKYKNQNNLEKVAELSSTLALLYWKSEKPEKALQFFEQSVAQHSEFGNSNTIKALYSYMGMVCSDMGQPETALVYFRKSLLVSRELSNKLDVGTNLINIAVTLNSLKRQYEAIENLEDALVVVVELGNKNMLITCYKLLSDNYNAVGDMEKSTEYYTLYSTFQGARQKEVVDYQIKKSEQKVAEIEKKVEHAIQEKVKTQATLAVTQDSLKLAAELNQLQQLKISNQQIKLDYQKLLLTVFIIGIIFIAAVALTIFLGLRQKQKHNAVLEKRNAEIRARNEEIKGKNHKINQSLNYAKNIQTALLPNAGELKKLFPESFVFFSPRDVVSGDFYWFNTVNTPTGTLKIVVVVDCTGHGVPGAFMSMLGLSFLDEIVIDKAITQPNLILEHMHQMVRTALKQEITGNTDGMDVAICVVNESEKLLYFGGAINPLVYIQNGEMNILKGDYFGLGGQMKNATDENCQFTFQTLDISLPTSCYLFSDGFSDQFGGEQGRKFLMKNFRALLHEISLKPMAEQKIILEKTLTDWQGDEYPRVDDIIVLGFRI